MINTIGKKIHTLVKENTPCCHKIRQECGFTEKVAFFYISLCFLPHCCANICREVSHMLPNTYQEIYDTHTCLNFSKMSKCVFILDASKSRCNFITLLGKYVQQKKVGWEVIFSELGLQGPSPGRSSRAAPSGRFVILF